jgi:hypothetical protein
MIVVHIGTSVGHEHGASSLIFTCARPNRRSPGATGCRLSNRDGRVFGSCRRSGEIPRFLDVEEPSSAMVLEFGGSQLQRAFDAVIMQPPAAGHLTAQWSRCCLQRGGLRLGCGHQARRISYEHHPAIGISLVVQIVHTGGWGRFGIRALAVAGTRWLGFGQHGVGWMYARIG